MDATRDTILTRVKNLMSKTVDNGATQQEAESAMAAAQRLMDQHNIAQADLIMGGSDVDYDQLLCYTWESIANNYMFAARVVEHVYSVKIVVKKTVNGRKTESINVVLFGDRANLDCAQWGLEFLGRTYKELWNEYRTQSGLSRRSMGAYYAGLTDGFLARVREERAALELACPSARGALVLVNDKLQKGFAKAFPNAIARTQKISDVDAYSQGKRDGAGINLAKPIGSGARRQLSSSPRAIAPPSLRPIGTPMRRIIG